MLMVIRVGMANAKNFAERNIIVKRPGIGWSSLRPERTVLDHTTDVRALSEHLNIGKYAAMVHPDCSLASI